MNGARSSRVVTLVTTALLAACGGTQNNNNAATPSATPSAATNSGASAEPSAAPEPTATAAASAEPPAPEPTPTAAAPSVFTASDEDRTNWQHAETVLDFNARANFGGGALRTGFTPDPWPFRLTAGGGRNPVDVASLNIRDSVTGEPCTRSFVTRRPDFHFNFQAGTTFELLRFYVVTENGADATLVINEPGTGWRCNDDHHREGWGNSLMPAIDFRNPPPGRYDIWVGTFDQSRNNRAQLFVTELDSNHP